MFLRPPLFTFYKFRKNHNALSFDTTFYMCRIINHQRNATHRCTTFGSKICALNHQILDKYNRITRQQNSPMRIKMDNRRLRISAAAQLGGKIDILRSLTRP